MKFPGLVQSKYPRVQDSIFSKMSALSNEYNAVNLSQGFPDFEVSSELIDLVYKYMKEGKNQYAPMPGVIELRQSISEKVEKLYGCKYDPETEITITAGATQALYTAINALVKSGDEVIIFTPAYDSYEPAIAEAGGKTIYSKLISPEFNIDWDDVKRKINIKTKMIIINSPHNPTGSTLSAADLLELEKIIEDKDIIILSDEVYEHIIFDHMDHMSVSRFPSLAKQSMVVGSFGKTFHATGWKMGFILAPQNLMKEFKKLHQYIVFAVNAPIQYALAEYLQKEENYKNLGSFYQKKRDFFLDKIKGSRFKSVPSNSTYFQLLDFKNIDPTKTDVQFAEWLVKEKGLATVPTSVFYHNPTAEDHYLRVCFAKDEDTLTQAAEIINAI